MPRAGKDNRRCNGGSKIAADPELPNAESEATDSETARLRRELDSVRERLRELQHVIRDSSQISLGVVSMIAARWNTADARAMAKEIRLRLGAVGLGLSYSEDGQVELSQCIDKLSREVESALGRQGIGRRMQVAPVHAAERSAISILLIAIELMANAYQHAFIGRPFGSIEISLSPVGDRHGALRIADNGVGLPPVIEANWSRLSPDRSYAGLPTVFGLARSCGGEVTLQAGGGTSVELVFPRQR